MSTFRATDADSDRADRQDEFLRLFSQHSRRIYEFILTLLVNHADAEEVYQNTCVVLWRKFDSYDPTRSFYPWACRIAQLEMLDLVRQGKRTYTLSTDVLEILIDEMAAQASSSAARHDALEDCLKKLDAGDRQLIEHRYYHQERPKEMATARSQPVYSIYRALSRIHDALRECVERTVSREQSR
jgi:RNA polymerase sigma-70 factor, ECF subfamily